MKTSNSILSTSVLTVALVALAGCEKSADTDMTKPTGPEIGKKADEPPGGEDQPIAVDPTTAEPGADETDAAKVDAQIAPTVDDESAKALVETGREVAAAIGAAIDAIDANQPDEARASLTKAQEGLDEIKATRPNIEIVVATWRGNRGLTIASTQPAVDTVPLLAMLTQVDTHDAEAIKARHELRKGQNSKSVSNADKVDDLGLVDANLIYQELDMPIAATEIHVAEAQELLDQAKPAQAKELLVRAVSSFDVIQRVVGAPEYKAYRLVRDAQAAFARGDASKAQEQLDMAAQLLEPLGQDQRDPQSQKLVTMLLEDLAPLRGKQQTGDTPDQKPEGTKPEATNQLDAFRRVERHAMSLVRRAAMRSVMESRQEQEFLALADALMWLEIAESEGVLDQARNERAGTHLMEAKAVLASARDNATPAAKPKFDDLHARVEKLTKLESATPRQPDAIESELRRIGFDLRMMMLDLGMAPADQDRDKTKREDKPKAKTPPKAEPKDANQPAANKPAANNPAANKPAANKPDGSQG
ncbi:YfdX family protein [Enhygromyxa salina]|uniref:YfdX protein n=1 Tax=Enhygromyxa salina TaxID=215803 RepID=A0A2S9YP85_9BACT|nr:YfdX family protein [Enhygromyxa salina]PRQ06882.1 YfdX protein [Enhygromyxa salina]